MPLFYQPDIPDGVLYLSHDESRHAIRVLRLKSGSVLEITDGKGFFYEALITDPDASKCAFRIVGKKPGTVRTHKIHIAIAPTKNTDRTEWFVEKAVELGIDEITLIQCLKSERKSMKTDRLEKIAVSAMKQAQQAWMPVIHEMVLFKNILFTTAAQKFIAHVDASNPLHLKTAAKADGNYFVLIGPEGDFDLEEIRLALDHGFQKVSLGASRLRTETAALAACHILNLIHQ